MKVEIEVSLPALLHTYNNGHDTISIQASTLKECFETLFQQRPLLERHLFDESGEKREHVLFFLNDSDTRWLDSPEQPLQTGDRLTILQAVSGG